jgi:hypothetical protein
MRKTTQGAVMFTYVITGHETAKCWQDDENIRRTYGPSEELLRTEDFKQVFPTIAAYFQKHQIGPDDLRRFVTVAEFTRRGNHCGERIFTTMDLVAPGSGLAEKNMIAIAATLIANGMKLGRSKV